MSTPDEGQAVTHPVWCDPTQCTAPAEQPTMEGWKGHGKERGEHRSAPVSGSWGGLAYLTQSVAPWECSVYLKFEPNGSAEAFSRESFELEPQSPLLLMIRQHVAAQQTRYPMLVPPLDVDEADRA